MSHNGSAAGNSRKPYPTTTPDKPKKPNDGLVARLGRLRAGSKRPMPTEYGDGTYPAVVKYPSLGDDLKAIGWADVKALVTLVKSKIKGETITDDKTMIMERVIALVAGLPSRSRLRERLTNVLIAELWNSLAHPPMLYVGEEYRYRRADGSNNNPLFPLMGAANTNYARTCKPHINPLGALPDPGQIFDAVMARDDGFKRHPNNVSSILWYWATIIIHDIFWTDLDDMNKNKTSSYLELSPLYGCSQEMQDSVRTFQGGLLKPDSYADKRLLGAPAGVSVLLVMFNRFHNHAAETLAEINEGGRFQRPSTDPDDPSEGSQAAWRRHDEDLFQTARLVTCGLYINITLVDYVRNIVNLNRVDTTWTLDPRQEAGVDVGTPEGAAAGVGNAVSAEFNLCYRWHSCISERDEKWVQKFYGEIFGGRPSGPPPAGPPGPPGPAPPGGSGTSPASPPPSPPTAAAAAGGGGGGMMAAFAKWEAAIPEDPVERVFGGLRRGEDGRYRDDDLAEMIVSSVEDVAGAFGARNVPRAMRQVEMLGIVRGRKWNLAGLNEFRRHFGLQPYRTFEDINSDPTVADQLRRLYNHPDQVELYPGLVAEEAKTPMVPGVGIAPTYTISRVVLSDAVSLVRGDRFYTTDYTARNLTAWGYSEADYDLGINHGCVFYKLFLRALPAHFRPDSVYAHYPMVIPSENRKILTALGRADRFDFSRPVTASATSSSSSAAAAAAPRVVDVVGFGAAQHVLENPDRYRVPWGEGLSFMLGDAGRRFMLAGDSHFHEGQRRCMDAQLYRPGWAEAVRTFFADGADRFLRERSRRVVAGSTGPTTRGHQVEVDLVRDVGNLLPVHFAARLFNLPLKTDRNPGGVYTEQELYAIFSTVFVAAFRDTDPARSFPLRQSGRDAARDLGQVIELNAKLTRRLCMRGLYTGRAGRGDPLVAYGTATIRGLARSGLSYRDIAFGHVLPTAAVMVPTLAEAFAQAVDFYLDADRASLRVDIGRLASQPADEGSDTLLLGYIMEGIRLGGGASAAWLRRDATSEDMVTQDDGREVRVPAGARVHVSLASSARDPDRFPDPDKVVPTRPLNSYLHHGFGPHACLGKDASRTALVEMFRALFRRTNLRRAPGPPGELKKVTGGVGWRDGAGRCGDGVVYMREDWASLWPLPCSMKVAWDE